MELGRLIGPELRELLREDPAQARELTDVFHPQDVSECLAELDDELAARAIKAFPLEYGAQVFERLEEDRQIAIAKTLGIDSTVHLVSEMDADDVVDFFALLPEETVKNLLHRLQKVDPEIAQDVRDLTQWPQYTAGGLMTSGFVEVPSSATVDETISSLRSHAIEGVEVLDVVFVLDETQRVVGFVTLRRLLTSPAQARIIDVMHHNLVSVPPEMDQEEVARILGRYDLNALPVLDAERRILGVITADDVLDVVEEEAEEDAQRMGALEPMDNSYFNVSFGTYLKKRAPWLLVLFVGGFFTTSAMEAFSPVLQAITQLSFYVPLLISAGGNSGSQSATMIIRGLAMGEIESQDWWRVMVRELAQGLTLGVSLAGVGALRAYFGGDGAEMALLVSITIVAIVTLGCVVGSMMPLLLHRFGVDPATSSTPFVATLVDVLGIVVYLSLARWILVGTSELLLTP